MQVRDYIYLRQQIFLDLNKLQGYIIQRIKFKIKKLLHLYINFKEHVRKDRLIVEFLINLDPYLAQDKVNLIELLNEKDWYTSIASLFDCLSADDIKLMEDFHLYSYFPEIYQYISDEVRIGLLHNKVGVSNQYKIIQSFDDLSKLISIGLEINSESLWYSIAQKISDYSEYLYRDGIRTFDNPKIYSTISDDMKLEVYNNSKTELLRLWVLRTIKNEKFVLEELIENQNIKYYKNGLQNMQNKRNLAELKLATNSSELMQLINNQNLRNS